MKLKKSWVLVVCLVVGLFVETTFAQSYDHSLKVDEMEFHWKVEGSNLAVKVEGKTTGWVGVGFNPVKRMQGANFILGYVKGGKLKITDEYGNRTTGHTSDDKRGGKDSILASSGSESGGKTTIEFKIPLNSGDDADSVIDPNGKTVILLAHGKRDSFRTGHNYYAIVEVNLNSGAFLVKR